MEKIRLLMLDDDQDDYLIVRSLLTSLPHRNYAIDWVATIDEGLVALTKESYDAFLVDYWLGLEEGTEFIRKALDAGYHQPFILLTAMDDPRVDEEAQTVGAADYVMKIGMRAHELDRSIRYARKHTENLQKIHLLNIELETKIADRTKALQEKVEQLHKIEEALRQLLEKEKNLNGLKSRFVSMASHEFRTPLTTINSSASLIAAYLEKQDPENIKKHVGRIKMVVNNLEGILADFLSLGKLDEGRIEVNMKALNLPDLVDETISEMKHLMKPGQTFDYIHTGEKTVFLDENLLKNILINLLSNAIKYSPENKRIQIETEVADGKTNIRVSDQGIGISEEDQKNLFNPFFRASNVGATPGTGLGLNITHRHVELMGGQIGCESTLGEGSCFWLKF